MRIHLRPVFGLALLAATVSGALRAEGLEYALRAGVGYSDNVLRTSASPTSTAAAVIGAQVAADRPTGRWRYSLAGDGAWNEYFDSDIEGQFLGSFRGETSYEFVPDLFAWNLTGSFDQLRRDVTSPLVPGNIEDSLSLATGPTLTFNLPGGFRAGLEGQYATTDYSDREFDNDTVGARAVVSKSFSERSILGVGASWDDVTYSSNANLASVDYKRQEFFARARLRGARTSLEADAGYAQIKGAGLDESGPMFRVSATRRLTPSISAFARLQREFPTSEPAALAGDGALITGEPRDTRGVDVGLEYQRPRTSGQLTFGSRREQGLVTQTSRRDVDSVALSVRRAMTPRSSVRVFGQFSTEQAPAAGLDDEEKSGGAELSLGFGRNIGVDLRVEYRDRTSPLPTNDYHELSAGLYVRYGAVAARSAVRGLGTN